MSFQRFILCCFSVRWRKTFTSDLFCWFLCNFFQQSVTSNYEQYKAPSYSQIYRMESYFSRWKPIWTSEASHKYNDVSRWLLVGLKFYAAFASKPYTQLYTKPTWYSVHLPCSTTQNWAIHLLQFILYVYNIYTNKKYHLKIIFGMWKTQNVNILFGSCFKQVNK